MFPAMPTPHVPTKGLGPNSLARQYPCQKWGALPSVGFAPLVTAVLGAARHHVALHDDQKAAMTRGTKAHKETSAVSRFITRKTRAITQAEVAGVLAMMRDRPYRRFPQPKTPSIGCRAASSARTCRSRCLCSAGSAQGRPGGMPDRRMLRSAHQRRFARVR